MGDQARSDRQRAHARVEYAADIRLERPDRGDSIHGRSLNLSPTGIFVRSDQWCAVGTPVTCEVPLPGGPRVFGGVVVRVQSMPEAGVGLGIQFENVTADDRTLLTKMVQVRGDRARLVKVKFEGLPEPVRARAVITEEGLRLSTSLPFLRVSSAVDVAMTGAALEMSSRGVLREVQLEPAQADGIPRLTVDVGLAEAAGRRQRLDPAPDGGGGGRRRRVKVKRPVAGARLPEPRRETFELPAALPPEMESAPWPLDEVGPAAAPAASAGAAWPTPAEDPRPASEGAAERPTHAAIPVSSPDARRGRGSVPRVRRRAADMGRSEGPMPPTMGLRWRSRLRPYATRLAGALTMLLGTAALSAYLIYSVLPRISARMGHEESGRTETAAPAGAATGSPRPAMPPAATISVPATPAPARQVLVPTARPQGPTPARPASNNPSGPEAAAASVAPTLGPVPAGRATPAPILLKQLPPGTRGPTITREGGRSTAIVPISGSTAEMSHYSLVHPRGVALHLPHARSELPLGLHVVRRDGFRTVWIRERPEGGIEVRFSFTRPPPDERLLEVDDSAVKVRVHLPDQP